MWRNLCSGRYPGEVWGVNPKYRELNGRRVVAGAMTDPDNVEAEFGVIVRSDLKGSGLGLVLMNKLIAYLRSQGTQRLVASVLDYNERMLKPAHTLGFKDDPALRDGDGTRGIVLPL